MFVAENSNKQNAGIAQSVVRRIGSAEVTSSILVASSEKSLRFLRKQISGTFFVPGIRYTRNSIYQEADTPGGQYALYRYDTEGHEDLL